MNKKVMDIKIYEEDFNLIMISLLSNVNHLNSLINDENSKLDDFMIKKLKEDKKKEKDLISRLNVCKLYNDVKILEDNNDEETFEEI